MLLLKESVVFMCLQFLQRLDFELQGDDPGGSVSVAGSSVGGSLALTMRSRRFFGRLYDMRGGSGNICLSLSLDCNMLKCLFTIWAIGGRSGW